MLGFDTAVDGVDAVGLARVWFCAASLPRCVGRCPLYVCHSHACADYLHACGNQLHTRANQLHAFVKPITCLREGITRTGGPLTRREKGYNGQSKAL
jgi:hypothetical protein